MTPEKERNPKPGRLGKILLVAGSLLVGLLASEMITRALDLATGIYRIKPGVEKSVYRLSDNPVLGYVYKENYRDDNQPDLMNSYPSTNSHGLRDIERDRVKKQGGERIILLGDSVVAGANDIYDLNDTISRQLERLLQREDIEVLNFGVNGYCTKAEVEFFKEKGLQFAPDLVVLLFVYNDFHNVNADLGGVDLYQPKIVNYLFVNSHLFRYAALRFNIFDLKMKFGVNDIAGMWIGDIDTNEEKLNHIINSDNTSQAYLKRHLLSIGDNNVEDGLKTLKGLSEQHGFEVIIGIWPVFFKEGIFDFDISEQGEFHPVVSDQKMVIELLADKYGFYSFRFSSLFIEDFQQRKKDGHNPDINPQDYYAVDSMHPNPTGTATAAKVLQQVLTLKPALLNRSIQP